MTPQETQRLATRLRAERERHSLSAHEVARRAGINVGTVTRIELGQIVSPRPENLLAIAAVLDIPASDIFALANWVQPDDLPNFSSYLRAKYGSLPEAAFHEMQTFFDSLALKYGTQGPAPHEDEY